MPDTITIEAQTRSLGAKSALRQLRLSGMVPAVMYGDAKEVVQIAVPQQVLARLYRSGRMLSTLLELKLGGADTRAILRDVQIDALTDAPIHADFLRLGKGTTIVVNIPVQFLNAEESPGIKRGGVLNVVRHELELRCPADALPNDITIDLSGSDIGHSFHISGVTLPDGVRPTIERDFTIATIAAPTKVEEPEVKPEGEEVEGEEGDAEGDAVEGETPEGEAADAQAKSGGDDKSGGGDKDTDKGKGKDKGKG